MPGSTLPLITAVIPTRWRPDLVLRAVDSVLAQTYPNVEVVVVVDGPDAATVRAVQRLEDSRVRVVSLNENVGGSEARNIGIREARGSWIAMLDDDDEWLPEKLARQMAAVSQPTSKHTLISCRRIERQPGQPDKIAPRRIYRDGEDVSEYMFYSDDKQRHTSGPQTSGYLATRELFLDVPFTKGLKCHQDWDWYLRAMRNEDTAAVSMEEPLYIMYVEPVRPRVTAIARWELSLAWVESRRQLFTERAFKSFLINECMYRCEEKANRTKIFRKLLGLSRKCGGLQFRDLFAAAKWYLFRPSVRLRLVNLYKQMKIKASFATVHGYQVEQIRAKGEVQG